MSDVSNILNASTAGSVTFQGETAGYRNAVGSYKIAPDGTIYDVQILFANASQVGSGGDLVAGKSSVGLSVGATDQVGFFVVPDGFDQSTASLLTSTTGNFKFVDANGNPGNVNSGSQLKLEYVSETGKVTDIKSVYGTETFHSVDDGSKGLNGDGISHIKVATTADGSVTIGFEDLKGGGDRDYDDAVIKFTPSEASKAFSAAVKAATDVPFKASGELLVDGSFEQANVGANAWSHQAVVGGWHSDTQIETWGKGFDGVTAADGNKIVELDYDAGKTLSNIYQNVNTEAGAEYTFTFDYAKRPDSGPHTDTINVYWNGQLVGSVDPTKTAWSVATFKVTGTGGSDRIEFRESADQNDSYGGLIDKASLVKTGASSAEKAEAVAQSLEKAVEDKAAAEKAAADAAAKAAADKAAADAAAKAAADKAAADAAAKAAADKAAAEQAAKDAADKAAAEQAAKDAADKAAAEQAAKDAADKAAAEQAAKDAADKAAAEQAAKDAADKAAAEQAAKDAADKAAAEQAAKDAADKAAAEQAAKDAADKAAAEQAAKDAADKAAADKAAHAEGLVLTAADATESVSQSTQVGTGKSDSLDGATGHDTLYGKGGDDTLAASNTKLSVLKLPIDVSLVNAADASAFNVVLSGVPQDAILSAGHNNGDGSWTLAAADLKGLTISTNSASDFSVHVAALASDGSGLSQATDVTVHVPAAAQNILVGGGGSDVIVGSASGDDFIYGGSIPTGAPADPNRVSTAADNDKIVAGDGNNHIWGNSGDDHITAGNGDNWISGGKGNDVITVGSGSNEVYGNSGDDHIFVGAGNNIVHGGTGFDTLDFSNVDGVTVDVKGKTAVIAGGGTSTFDGVEAFIGSNGNDTFVAGKHGEVFTGNGGDDTFVFSRGDIVSKGVALAAHEITDFHAGDTLDLRGVFAGHNFQGLEKSVQLVEDDKGTHVYAKISQQLVEVVVLDNFHGHTAADLVKDGSFLV